MYELKNIFDVFLPQLLLYPNPKDPLNPEAASMMLNYKTKYEKKVTEIQLFQIREYIEKYAKDDKIITSKSLEPEAEKEVKVEEDQEADKNSDAPPSDLSATSDIEVEANNEEDEDGCDEPVDDGEGVDEEEDS